MVWLKKKIETRFEANHMKRKLSFDHFDTENFQQILSNISKSWNSGGTSCSSPVRLGCASSTFPLVIAFPYL